VKALVFRSCVSAAKGATGPNYTTVEDCHKTIKVRVPLAATAERRSIGKVFIIYFSFIKKVSHHYWLELSNLVSDI
jgi:hypothetical protein